MAYTKVFAIRARLDDRVKYAVNGEKTELDERIVYTADPEKTDTVRFVTTLNCRSAETAFAAMQKTKKKYKKTGGVLGYLVLDRIRAMLPYALALSAASFLYIAMCELVPRITAGVSDRRSFWRLAVLLLAGAAVAFLIGIEH